MKTGKRVSANAGRRIELGRYIVADPEICHGEPTFKGTRIMMRQIRADVSEGRSWDFICNTRWRGRIPLDAISEAVHLAREAWLEAYSRNNGPQDLCRRSTRQPSFVAGRPSEN